jgi:hypothetical protein
MNNLENNLDTEEPSDIIDITLRSKQRDDFHSCKVLYILRGIRASARIKTDSVKELDNTNNKHAFDKFVAQMQEIGVSDEKEITSLYDNLQDIGDSHSSDTKIDELARRMSTALNKVDPKIICNYISRILLCLEDISQQMLGDSDSDSDESEVSERAAGAYDCIRDKHFDLRSILCYMMTKNLTSKDGVTGLLSPLCQQRITSVVYTKNLKIESRCASDLTLTKGTYKIVEQSGDRLLPFFDYPTAKDAVQKRYSLILLSDMVEEDSNKVNVRSELTELNVTGTIHVSSSTIVFGFNIENRSAAGLEMIKRIKSCTAIFWKDDQSKLGYSYVPFTISKKALRSGCVVIRLFIFEQPIKEWAKSCCTELTNMLASVINTLSVHKEAFYSPGLCINMPNDIHGSICRMVTLKSERYSYASMEELGKLFLNSPNSSGTKRLESDTVQTGIKCLVDGDECPQGFGSRQEAVTFWSYILSMIEVFTLFTDLKDYNIHDRRKKISTTKCIRNFTRVPDVMNKFISHTFSQFTEEIENRKCEKLNYVYITENLSKLRKYTNDFK